ncbi:helix-turn-helix domain-containing protein [Spirosoma linguale]|uniref:Transcriptional regulator, AraC family n=1 Tax=Spirosoma linguale (strain ATCC 33905 / DSM 74 / LMG 10896 / Claus 1) TaxID=504472 RepID=D2QTR3_SPILD|nr:transcriptional regulator, AraC family [Spirosoma linguale DSM 74]
MKNKLPASDSAVPVYQLQSFPRHEPNKPFYMIRLERLVQEFKGIDKSHTHTFYLVMWISRGSGTHTIDFKTYTIEPNQLYFLTPGQVHSWALSADTQGFNLFFDANFFKGRFGSRLYQYPFFHSHQHQPLLSAIPQPALFTDLLAYAYQEYEAHQPNRSDVFLSFVHILLETASRLYHEQQIGTDTYLYDRVRQYEELLENQFLTVREVSAYASQMNLTPNYLNHICRLVVGKTASQLWQERLLIETQRLLTHTAQSIKEIGFQLGFNDPSYFVRFFKKQTGQTPAEFRQSLVGSGVSEVVSRPFVR